MTTQDAQVRKMVKEYTKTGSITKAAGKAGLSPKTARKWHRAGVLPSEAPKKPRAHRTWPDAFADVWDEVKTYIQNALSVDAKALFEKLQSDHPGRWKDGELRTFQRRVNEWRAKYGPPIEVFFPQDHVPGEAMQLDFTSLKELGITVLGEEYCHLLCHTVLPYSNWEWGTLAKSESMLAIKRGFQAALFQLGKTPEYLQTDNSTAATHVIGASDKNPSKEGRTFNQDYQRMCDEFGIKPRTTGIGCKEQNGDIESSNNQAKRTIRNALVLRGSNEFKSIDELEIWIQGLFHKKNLNPKRQSCLQEELCKMSSIRATKQPEYLSYEARVSQQSTVSVKYNVYSVPSSLIGQKVEVRLFEWHLEIRFAGKLMLQTERLIGRHLHRIEYRHIIDSLLKKPGAFQRYRYQADMFPRECFRMAYEKLCETRKGIDSDVEYLRILHLAAHDSEEEVAIALQLILSERVPVNAETVKALLRKSQAIAPPQQEQENPDLQRYDRLLKEVA